ncbi:MAG: hypothetical protein D6702_07175 [Planctomycetota bacterium]|nr:MAG: hypothetical protein D6702_07175 [Planctomycetota bacterium]
MKTSRLLLLLPVLALACSGEEQPAPPEETGAAPAAEQAADQADAAVPAAEVHKAICGHALEEVGHCGNYIEVDGKWVELSYPGLGAMEYCSLGDKGCEVKVAGEIKDGKFVAVSYEKLN